MGYDLHIKRTGERPLTLDEWRAAIETTDGVRLFEGAYHTYTNPQTGELLQLVAKEGDAEIFFTDTGEWYSVFSWHRTSATFRAPRDADMTLSPVWRVAAALAVRLGAAIHGDEGEGYDLKSGKVIKSRMEP
jgi:hypothetical protein